MKRIIPENINTLGAQSYIMLETHAHTSEVSLCGDIPGATLAKAYAELNYSGLIITDHVPLDKKTPHKRTRMGYLKGYLRAKEAGEKLGLTVLPGAEVRFYNDGDDDFLIVGLNENTFLDIFEAGNLQDMKALCDERGWLIFQAHPYRNGRNALVANVHGIEVYNGHPGHNSGNPRAYATAKKHNLMMLSGSDVHTIQNVGRGGIYLPSEVNLSTGLVEYMARVRTPVRLEAE